MHSPRFIPGVKQIWVTDVVCLPNVKKVAVATTERDITFYDCSANAFENQKVVTASDDSNLVFTDESGKTYVLQGNILVPTEIPRGPSEPSPRPPCPVRGRKPTGRFVGAGVYFDETEYRCGHCVYSAENLLYMNQHVMNRHPEAANPPAIPAVPGRSPITKRCAFCDFPYKNLLKLKEHLEAKHQLKSAKNKSSVLSRNKPSVVQSKDSAVDNDKWDPMECK